jgi:hypothetical protein
VIVAEAIENLYFDVVDNVQETNLSSMRVLDEIN